jgi:hypothetical protein
VGDLVGVQAGVCWSATSLGGRDVDHPR